MWWRWRSPTESVVYQHRRLIALSELALTQHPIKSVLGVSSAFLCIFHAHTSFLMSCIPFYTQHPGSVLENLNWLWLKTRLTVSWACTGGAHVALWRSWGSPLGNLIYCHLSEGWGSPLNLPLPTRVLYLSGFWIRASGSGLQAFRPGFFLFICYLCYLLHQIEITCIMDVISYVTPAD